MAVDPILVTVAVAPAATLAGFALGGPGVRSRIKWAVLCMLVWPVALVLAYRRLRGRSAEGDAPGGAPGSAGGAERARPVPVQPADADDLGDVPLPVHACPSCGFLGIRPPGVQDGVWPGGGELIFQVCPRCAYRGMPIEFHSREAYGRFLRELQRPLDPQQ